MRIGFDLAALGHLDAKFAQPKPVGEGLAPGGHQNDIGVDHVSLSSLAQLIGDFGLGFGASTPCTAAPMTNFKPCFFKILWKGFLHLGVHARGDRVKEFDHRDLGPKPGIDDCPVPADHAGADHHQLFGIFASSRRAG